MNWEISQIIIIFQSKKNTKFNLYFIFIQI